MCFGTDAKAGLAGDQASAFGKKESSEKQESARSRRILCEAILSAS